MENCGAKLAKLCFFFFGETNPEDGLGFYLNFKKRIKKHYLGPKWLHLVGSLLTKLVELVKLMWQHIMKSINSQRFRFYSVYRLVAYSHNA